MIPNEPPAALTQDTLPARKIQFILRAKLDDIKAFARREPVQAVAAAFGVGLLINLLPSRVVAGTVSTVGAALLRPVLLSLGVTKAIELACNKSSPLPNS